LLAIVVLAGCGSGRRTTTSDRGFLDRNTLEAQVKALGNALLRQHARLSHARRSADIRDVACVKSEGDRRTFQCRLSYSSGDNKTLVVMVNPDGSGWRIVPKPRRYVPLQQRV